MSWTKERIEMLTKLAAEGLTATQIARQIGDTTRNAVIGQIKRKSIKWMNSGDVGGGHGKRKPRSKIEPKPEATRPRPPKIAQAPLPRAQATDIARISFVSLENHHCRFIPGDPLTVSSGDPLYCGLQKMHGSPWCEGHHHMCTEPAGTRRLWTGKQRMAGHQTIANANEFTDAN